MTVSMGLLLLVTAVWMVTHKGADWPALVLGACIGVTGADGWVGQLVRALLDAVARAGESLSQVEVF